MTYRPNQTIELTSPDGRIFFVDIQSRDWGIAWIQQGMSTYALGEVHFFTDGTFDEKELADVHASLARLNRFGK